MRVAMYYNNNVRLEEAPALDRLGIINIYLLSRKLNK